MEYYLEEIAKQLTIANKLKGLELELTFSALLYNTKEKVKDIFEEEK